MTEAIIFNKTTYYLFSVAFIMVLFLTLKYVLAHHSGA